MTNMSSQLVDDAIDMLEGSFCLNPESHVFRRGSMSIQLPTIGAFKHLAAEMPEIAARRGLFNILRG